MWTDFVGKKMSARELFFCLFSFGRKNNSQVCMSERIEGFINKDSTKPELFLRLPERKVPDPNRPYISMSLTKKNLSV